MNGLKLFAALALLLAATYLTAGAAAAPENKSPVLSVQPHNHYRSLAPGSLVTFNVKVSDFPAFDGWDIYVRTNDSALLPVSIKIGGLFSSYYNATYCVNDTGFGCTILDGPGVVHSSIASLSGDANGTGTLFSITYQVQPGQGTPVVPFLDSVFDPLGATIVHITKASSYGTVGPPDFTLSIHPYLPPLKGIYTIIVNSVNGFNGTVDFSATASPGLTLTILPSSVSLGPANIGDSATLLLNWNNPGTYTMIITGTSSNLTHSITLTVTL
ncbi:MAG TPA: hypothetical protein VNW25_00245 [Candidatus Sulfotelmatobacter sp.]|nr:hypothetical protein [Candidatus Sulfotelmatobacter sp.]